MAKKTGRYALLILLLSLGVAVGVFLYQGDPLSLTTEDAPQPSAQDIAAIKARVQGSIIPLRVRFTDPTGTQLTQQGSVISLGNGDFLTAAHVVQVNGHVNAIQAIVKDTPHDLTLVEARAPEDLAKLRAAHTRWPGITQASQPLQPGDAIFIAGYPEKYAGVVAPQLIVTSGQVLDVSFSTPLVGVSVIKATAKTDRGGSGGALLNRDGELCGVVIAASSAQDKTTYIYAVPYAAAQ